MTPDDTMLAAELALGLIEGHERAAAQRRVLADPAFARAVERWRGDFAAMVAGVRAVEPPPALEERVAAAVADTAPAANGARGWRRATAALAAVAAALLATIILDRHAPAPVPAPPAPAPAPVLLAAALAPAAAGGKANAAVYDAASGRIRLAAPVATPHGHSAELWSIGGNGVPHALGMLADARVVTVRAADRGRVIAGATLAISIEPAGGAPGPRPTGPVIATGALARV